MIESFFSSPPFAGILVYLLFGFSSFCTLPVIINLMPKRDYRIGQHTFIFFAASYFFFFSLILYPSDFWSVYWTQMGNFTDLPPTSGGFKPPLLETQVHFENAFLNRLSQRLTFDGVLWTAAAINLALSFGMTYILGCRLKSLDRTKMLLWLLAVPLVSPIFIIRACFWKDR